MKSSNCVSAAGKEGNALGRRHYAVSRITTKTTTNGEAATGEEQQQ